MPIRDELIARTLQQLANLLARLVGADGEAVPVEAAELAAAEQELDQLYLANLGSSRVLIHRLSSEDLIKVLGGSGHIHEERAYVLGALLSAEADLLASREGTTSSEVARLRAAALDMLLEAGASKLGEPDLKTRVDRLSDLVPSSGWPNATYGRRFRYEWGWGDLGRAETALFEWLENAGGAEQRLEAASAADGFYDELSQLSDEKLEDGGFTREEIGEGRADFALRLTELLTPAAP